MKFVGTPAVVETLTGWVETWISGVTTVRTAALEVRGLFVAAGWLTTTLYWSPLSVAVEVAGVTYPLLLAPATSCQLDPLSSDFCHCQVKLDPSEAEAVTLNAWVSGWYTEAFDGWPVIMSVGWTATVKVAELDVIEPPDPATSTFTLYLYPSWDVAAEVIV